ncbi:Pheromone-processing carboxypeptidase KEX1 [Trametes pubescens]|uniref:Pheromone-processing carboxypeptidase KEX1 n=1 Tax=Trametes pubescens TaxID=154538 RepID=A0A1M2VG62_TRAPU|nr:Pheromone-processing carboxypeptidase KEX1 [Trametes pubescens]
MFTKSIYTLSLLCAASARPRRALPNSYPHAWPGQPEGDYSPEWQSYFEVKDLPPVIPTGLPRSFAGNLPVDRAGHKNDTLFFWGFEREGGNGTLTAPADANNTDPWILWLQGGPGSSGMLGLSTENGPIHVLSNGSWVLNPYSWNTLADTVWMDQPVGTGFSTSDSKGYAADEDQIAEDFLKFLTNLVKVFPSLATRPLYLMGQSYAGHFIPYIVKNMFGRPSNPVTLANIAIGNGVLGSVAAIRNLPVVNILETYPAIIGYDQDIFDYFREQNHLCGFDLNLTYPQVGTFPTLNLSRGQRDISNSAKTKARTAMSLKEAFVNEPAAREHTSGNSSPASERLQRRADWKRDLSGRANGSLDPWYGCDLFDEMRDYALNFTYPWSQGGFDVYDIPDATAPSPLLDAAPFLNAQRTRAALHAPTSKNWSSSFDYPFGSMPARRDSDPSVEPIAFMSELAANASARNIPFVFYSGNDDARVQHRGTEVIIQNFTFGGIQGFTRKPSTPWFDDDGDVAGIVHQERNLTYVLFTGAGHLVPLKKPAQALVFLREFVLGTNKNGTVEGSDVVGGENASLAGDYLPGGAEIFYGSGTTAGTFMPPSATIAAWNSFLATATATTAASATSSVLGVSSSSVPTTATNGATGRATR